MSVVGGQTSGWIKIPLGDIVLDGDSAHPSAIGAQQSRTFGKFDLSRDLGLKHLTSFDIIRMRRNSLDLGLFRYFPFSCCFSSFSFSRRCATFHGELLVVQ